ncbi:MAG: hypothetical protein K0S43_397 [Cellulosimicrobium sp.]|jgi:hypothetical protein|nr:hypothetical protein [Cellulosimicrobium sp.]
MTNTTTDRAEVFTDEQRRRANALTAARATLAKTGFASGEIDAPVAEIIDLAEYIISGTHPLDRYDETESVRTETVDERAEETATRADD